MKNFFGQNVDHLDAFIDTAQGLGATLVEEYDQSLDTRWGRTRTAKDGACLGLSIRWLGLSLTPHRSYWRETFDLVGMPDGHTAMRLVKHGQVYDADMDIGVMEGLDIRGRVDRLMTSQAQARNQLVRNNLVHGEMRRGGLGFRSSTEVFINDNVRSYRQLAAQIVAARGCHCLIKMIGTDRSESHAVAALSQVAGHEMRFFDPNFGEVRFRNPGAFSHWFVVFCQRFGGGGNSSLGSQFVQATIERYRRL